MTTIEWIQILITVSIAATVVYVILIIGTALAASAGSEINISDVYNKPIVDQPSCFPTVIPVMVIIILCTSCLFLMTRTL